MSSNKKKFNKIIWIAGGLIIIGLVFFALKPDRSAIAGPLAGKAATVYRSATCGCCANYIAYLRRQGIKVEEKITGDMTAIKKQFGVPGNLLSCHTTRIDGYTVEGHVPAEGVVKLLAERPDVSGIGLPGMPSGSPGMPGAKYGSFEVSSFSADGVSAYYVGL